MRSRLLTIVLPPVAVLVVALALPLAIPSAAVAGGCPGASAKPSEVALEKLRKATRCLLNQRREAHGKGRLGASGKLVRAATRHSRAMESRNFFSHQSPDGSALVDRVRRTGYLSGSYGWSLAENIGWGSGTLATPRAMVRAWMESPGHRANILHGKFRDVGVGVVRGAPVRGYSDAATYTTDFGRR